MRAAAPGDGGPVVVRRFVSLERLRGNNEVAGFKFATVGVLYAVLLAFAVVVVWEKFSQAENEVANEAGAAATLYRLWDGIGAGRDGPARARPRPTSPPSSSDEWPAMAAGHESPAATEALNALYARLLADRPADDFGDRPARARRSTSSTSSPRRGGRGSSWPRASSRAWSGRCSSAARR